MRFSLNVRGIAIAMFTAAVPLVAQQSAVPVADPWAPFFGCWSTSSGGAQGPMVCVVPVDSADRVEFMTVDADSVVGRTVVDASGTRRAQLRGGCVGWEEARWSTDQRRLYIHADYSCGNGRKQRADAIIAMTRTDAFTQVEGAITSRETRTNVVNFIAQLDTTIFPAEVKRRLSSDRPRARNDGELEAVNAVSESDVTDAATNLDPAVVQAWLADRGERTEMSVSEMRSLRLASVAASRPPLIVPRAMARTFLAAGYQNIPAALRRLDRDDYRGESAPTNILVTPAMVNFGGSGTGFPQTSRGVVFRWP